MTLRQCVGAIAAILTVIPCRHKHMSWPMYRKVVCLDCAREFEYDWESMRINRHRWARTIRTWQRFLGWLR